MGSILCDIHPNREEAERNMRKKKEEEEKKKEEERKKSREPKHKF